MKAVFSDDALLQKNRKLCAPSNNVLLAQIKALDVIHTILLCQCHFSARGNHNRIRSEGADTKPSHHKSDSLVIIMPMVFVSIFKQIQGHSVCQSQECE